MAISKVLAKRFNSFEAEEQWLKEQAECGWRLIDYGREGLFDETKYEFEVDLEARNVHYKIDYVHFKSDADFEDYKELFHESGWELITKNKDYDKQIFISKSNKEIFSDNLSLIKRQQRRRSGVMLSFTIFSMTAIIAAITSYFTNYDWLKSVTLIFILLTLNRLYTLYKYSKKIRHYKNIG